MSIDSALLYLCPHSSYYLWLSVSEWGEMFDVLHSNPLKHTDNTSSIFSSNWNCFYIFHTAFGLCLTFPTFKGGNYFKSLVVVHFVQKLLNGERGAGLFFLKNRYAISRFVLTQWIVTTQTNIWKINKDSNFVGNPMRVPLTCIIWVGFSHSECNVTGRRIKVNSVNTNNDLNDRVHV